jgi:hypothetical protein
MTFQVCLELLRCSAQQMSTPLVLLLSTFRCPRWLKYLILDSVRALLPSWSLARFPYQRPCLVDVLRMYSTLKTGVHLSVSVCPQDVLWQPCVVGTSCVADLDQLQQLTCAGSSLGSRLCRREFSSGHNLLSKGLLVVLLITMLVKRDVENASASLAGFNTRCSFVLMSVLVSTVSDISLVDNSSISLGDQARVTKGVLNEREVLLDFVSLVYLKWF